MSDHFKEAALNYHRLPTPGKISVTPTKGLTNQSDLALAYSPGVAEASLAIAQDESQASSLTARANLVAVISNGTAVLGLGDIGPLAAKPVMEGKAVLFKKFANIDVFDIEIAEKNPDRLIEIIAALEPTFGGINLEDIKAPECFYIERCLRSRMKIPVFHDDQHGTAVVVAAAVSNGLQLVNKNISQARLVVSGAGAAAMACLNLLIKLGLNRENVWVFDIKGLVHRHRDDLQDDDPKTAFAKSGEIKSITQAMVGADVFLGLSAGGVLKSSMVQGMARDPLILALANPIPEIMPEEVFNVRSDAIVATGRSDYPNQVNNVLCFPYIFRGALDVGATTITDGMMFAAVRAIAELAQAESSDIAVKAAGGVDLVFGRDYLIPKPFDPRLIVKIAPAVAMAAQHDGVATRPLPDLTAYQNKLNNFIYHSGFAMKSIFSIAKLEPRRVLFAEGEEERVLRAVQIVLDEKLARPVLIGRVDHITRSARKFGLKLIPGENIDVINPDSYPKFQDLLQDYQMRLGRSGVTPPMARYRLRHDSTLFGTSLLRHGEVDAMICGVFGRYAEHLRRVSENLGLDKSASSFAAMNMLLLPNRTLFICDTYVNENPDARTIADIAILAAEEVERFGVVPKVALLSHSNFGSTNTPGAQKMREARRILAERAPHLEMDGEMHGDSALIEEIRLQQYAQSSLKGEANLLIMPNLDAANIAFNLLKVSCGDNITVGPILLGCARAVHILTPTTTVRRLVNMTALAAADVAMKQQVLKS